MLFQTWWPQYITSTKHSKCCLSPPIYHIYCALINPNTYLGLEMSREFWIGHPEHNRIEDRITVYLEEGDLRPPPDRSKSKIQAKNGEEEPFLLVGFDTEFKTPSYSVTREEIVAGMATSLILSYQFYAKCSDGRVWSGICCPDNGERLELSEFMLFVLGTGARQHGYVSTP